MGRERKNKCPEGIEIRKSASGHASIRILFYYQGILCRESFKLEVTPANIKYAARRRIAALEAIERNTFNYAEFFPNSKQARRFGHAAERVLFKTMLDIHLEEKRKSMENSTYIRYKRNCITHIYPNFGDIAIQDLKAATIREWIKTLSCKRKTIGNILIPLRAVIRRALADNYIDYNPLDKVNLQELLSKAQKKSQFVIDPFDLDEINVLLINAEGQIKNFYQFAFFSGLRPSELMGLRWSDIDWVHSQARIEETIVDKEAKDPKTLSGFREVLLLPPALEALKNQKQYTFLMGNRVFHNPLTNSAWETSQQLRRTIWMPLLKRSGVRYRNPYQTRHTYASMMMSQGENVMWLSKQMGHADAQVTLKRYARWIPDTTNNGGYKLQGNWNIALGKVTQKVTEERVVG